MTYMMTKQTSRVVMVVVVVVVVVVVDRDRETKRTMTGKAMDVSLTLLMTHMTTKQMS